MILSTEALAAADLARARAEAQYDEVLNDALDLIGIGHDPTEAYVLLCQRVAAQLNCDPADNLPGATAIAMLVASAVWQAQYTDGPPNLGLAA